MHGLNGDHINTWKHDETGVVWPRDLLPKEIPNARVLSFGYSADIYNNPNIGLIREHARTLLNLVNDERPSKISTRPIVFVAHSLGGLVVKQVSLAANS